MFPSQAETEYPITCPPFYLSDMAPTSSSTSRSPSISSTPPVDRIELEAAEVLAGLAGDVCRNSGEEVSHRVDYKLLSIGNSAPNSSYLGQDRKQDAELKSNPNSATRYASSRCSKSRQNLTEAEKETRRLGRVLANREAARQTIRRRQAHFDELTRKAADLAMDNEKLKRVKELAEKEYDSLRSTNERLKAEMSKIMKSEKEESQEETNSIGLNTSTAQPTNCPIFIYNHPSFLQYSPQTPFYVVPYPWIFPLPHHSSGPDLQQNETSPPNDNKTEPSTSIESISADKNQEHPFGFPPDRGGPCPRGTIFKPTPLISTSNHQDDPKKVVEVFAAVDARKKRKELKSFRDVKCK